MPIFNIISIMPVLQNKLGVGINVTPTNAEALTQSYLPQPASFTIAERFRLDLSESDFTPNEAEAILIQSPIVAVAPEILPPSNPPPSNPPPSSTNEDDTYTGIRDYKVAALPSGVREVEIRDGDNQPTSVLYRPPITPEKQLYIVEYHRVSMFKGRFGLGNIVGSQSLAPSEELTLMVRTYKQSILEKNRSETILDAINKETSDGFTNPP
jgi:hypothetical protein